MSTPSAQLMDQRAGARTDPVYSDLSFTAGLELLDRSRLTQALESFDAAASRHPGSAKALAMRGFARGSLGDGRGAAADFDRRTPRP